MARGAVAVEVESSASTVFDEAVDRADEMRQQPEKRPHDL
jgi:hypothetical protein